MVNFMHINTVKTKGFYVSYDLETIDGEIQIVARFVKNGQNVHKIYNIRTLTLSGAEMVAKLIDSDFAKKKSEEMIDEAKKANIIHLINYKTASNGGFIF